MSIGHCRPSRSTGRRRKHRSHWSRVRQEAAAMLLHLTSPNAAADFWATICKTVCPRCYRTVVLSCPLSATLVYCGQMGWILQDATWYGGRPRSRRHCVRWGPSSPHGKVHSPPPFSGHVYRGQTIAHLSNCSALVRILSPSDAAVDR